MTIANQYLFQQWNRYYPTTRLSSKLLIFLVLLHNLKRHHNKIGTLSLQIMPLLHPTGFVRHRNIDNRFRYNQVYRCWSGTSIPINAIIVLDAPRKYDYTKQVMMRCTFIVLYSSQFLSRYKRSRPSKTVYGIKNGSNDRT